MAPPQHHHCFPTPPSSGYRDQCHFVPLPCIPQIQPISPRFADCRLIIGYYPREANAARNKPIWRGKSDWQLSSFAKRSSFCGPPAPGSCSAVGKPSSNASTSTSTGHDQHTESDLYCEAPDFGSYMPSASSTTTPAILAANHDFGGTPTNFSMALQGLLPWVASPI